MDIFCIEFHPTCSRNMGNRDRNSITPRSKSVTLTYWGFIKIALDGQIFVTNFHGEFYENSKFDVHGSVHLKNILIYVQQDATLHSLFYLETVLHVSGGNTTHHKKLKQLYLHLAFVRPLLLPITMLAITV